MALSAPPPALIVAINSNEVLPDLEPDNNTNGNAEVTGTGGEDEERKAKITLCKTGTSIFLSLFFRKWSLIQGAQRQGKQGEVREFS